MYYILLFTTDISNYVADLKILFFECFHARKHPLWGYTNTMMLRQYESLDNKLIYSFKSFNVPFVYALRMMYEYVATVFK